MRKKLLYLNVLSDPMDVHKAVLLSSFFPLLNYELAFDIVRKIIFELGILHCYYNF